MYFYESHLGGIYTADEQLDYDYLYCEQCGDSDTLMFRADSAEEAWDEFRSETDCWLDSPCTGCEKQGSEFCEYECEDAPSGCWDMLYIMGVIVGAFPSKQNVKVVVAAHDEETGAYLRTYIGDKYNNERFPECTVPSRRFTDEVAQRLLSRYSEYIDTPEIQRAFFHKINGKNYYIVDVSAKIPVRENHDGDEDGRFFSSWDGDAWTGWTPVEALDLSSTDNELINKLMAMKNVQDSTEGGKTDGKEC